MMRTVNTTLLIIILAVTAGLSLGFYFLYKFQVGRNAEAFLREGRRSEQRARDEAEKHDTQRAAEDFRSAVRNYSTYISLRPDDVDAQQAYADLLMYLHEVGSAFMNYEQVLRKDPDRDEVRRKVVSLALGLGQRSQLIPDPSERVRQSAEYFTLAGDHLASLLERHPEDAELLEMLGRCQAALGHEDSPTEKTDAVRSFQKAIELKPDQLRSYSLLANILRRRPEKGAEEADKLMETMVEANPKSCRAHYLAGNYWRSQGKMDEARKEAERALELDGDDRDALLLAVNCAVAEAMRAQTQTKPDEAQKAFDRARQHARHAIERNPEDVDLYEALAEVEARSGHLDKAQEIVRDGLKATGDNARLLWTAANMLLDANKPKDAEPLVSQFAAVQASAETLELSGVLAGMQTYLQARLAFANEQWRKAVDLFDECRGAFLTNPQFLRQLDFLTGRAQGFLGNYDKEVQAYRRSLDADPFYGPALAALMDSYINHGQLDKAVELYRQASSHLGGSWLGMVRLLILRTMQAKPAERDWSVVEQALDDVEKREPNAWQIPLLRCEVLMNQGRAADAEQLLLKTRDRFPELPEVWNALEIFAQREQNWDKAEAVLRDARAKVGDRIELRLSEARLLARRDSKNASEKLRALRENLDAFSDAERNQLLSGLVTVAVQIQDLPLAREFAQEVAKRQPANVQIRFLLLELAMRLRDLEGMDPMLADIEKLEGKGPLWHYGQAVKILMGKDVREHFGEAQNHLAQAAEARPSWSRVPMLQGSIAQQQGQPDRAIEYYRKAIELGERNPAAIREFSQLLFQRRQYAEASSVIALLENPPEQIASDLERIRGRSALQLGDFDQSLELARKTAANSQIYQDHLWLGELLQIAARQAGLRNDLEQGKQRLAEAEASLRKATQLAPETPDTWVSLIRMYTLTDAKQKAQEAFEEARKAIPSDQSPLGLAQCKEAMGDFAGAEEQYQEALKGAPQDVTILRAVADFYWRNSKFDSAEKYIQTMLKGDLKIDPALAIWARRIEAGILAARGGMSNLQKALDVIDSNLKDDPTSVIDLRVKANILTTLPLKSQREEAAHTLENLVNNKPDAASPEDQFLLAQLYQALDRWGDFNSLMLGLLAKDGSNTRYLTTYIRALLDRGELQNAELYLDQLERAKPSLFATAQFRAELYFRREQYDKALQTLKSYLSQPIAEGTQPATRLRLVADEMAKFARQLDKPELQTISAKFASDAQTTFKQYLDLQPGNDIQMVGFLVRLKHAEEAVGLLEQLWPKSQPWAIAQAASEFIRREDSGEPVLRRVEAVLAKALEQFQRATPLLIVTADFNASQARPQEAEKFYREVLDRESKNPSAMNNLAVLFAVQKRNLDEALKLVNQAIEIVGPRSDILDTRATVYIALGNPKKALDDLAESIRDLPEPIRYFHQAQAYDQTGQADAATQSLQRAVDLGLTADSVPKSERASFEQLRDKLLKKPEVAQQSKP